MMKLEATQETVSDIKEAIKKAHNKAKKDVPRISLVDLLPDVMKEYKETGTPKGAIDKIVGLGRIERARLYDMACEEKKGKASNNNPYMAVA